MKLNELQLPVDPMTDQRADIDGFLVDYALYKQQRDAHRLTLNTPAPFPKHEVFRVAYERGEEIEVERADPAVEQARTEGRDLLKEFDALAAEVRDLAAAVRSR
jgi:hypothetical protein